MYLLLFIFGIVAGSFLNVCIFRIPKGKSIIYPGSRCTHCNAELHTGDLIPILSYLLLGGKCKYCKSKISGLYPLVEFLSGINFVFLFFLFGFSTSFIFYLIMFSLFIVIFFIDLKEYVIPDSLVIFGVIVSLLFNALKGQIVQSISGALAGIIIMYAILLFGRLIFKKEALGFGDVTLSAMLGAMLGVKFLIIGLFSAYIIAAVVSSLLMILKLRGINDMIPFGPFLVAGAAIGALWGEQIFNWYLTVV